jgi:hypothetical protein
MTLAYCEEIVFLGARVQVTVTDGSTAGRKDSDDYIILVKHGCVSPFNVLHARVSQRAVLPIVSHSNHMLISHHQEDIGDFHTRDLEMTPKGQFMSKVKVHFYLLGNGEHMCLLVPGA